MVFTVNAVLNDIQDKVYIMEEPYKIFVFKLIFIQRIVPAIFYSAWA
jgi:hypothetical protein